MDELSVRRARAGDDLAARPRAARRQAEHHAEQARAKADEQRERQTGVSGWVSERAGK